MRARSSVSRAKSLLVLALIALLCAALLLTASGCGTGTVASTSSGKVQGQVVSNGTIAFKGIPYAAPPVGNLRFMPPQPARSWSNTLQATRYGKVAPQPPDPLTSSSSMQQSEDCLSLNVWTPGLDNARRPVMVWIHGGGFTNGSGADEVYDGANMAKRGNVTVVTINYRLGPFGFLYLAPLGGQAYSQSGNLGLLDQVAAIKWVKDNIASFGGDPSNITAFGESAGSMSVCSLLAMPAAKGLFQKAIAESGAASMAHSAQGAAAVTAQFMKAAGVTDISGLQALSTKQVVDAENSMSNANTGFELLFGPVIDGAAIPQPPLQSIASGSAAGVDLLIGTNLNEMNLWTVASPLLATAPLSAAVPFIPIAQSAIALTSLRTPDAVAASYQSRRTRATVGEVSLAALTDAMFRVPAIRVAEAQASRQPKTWMYLFTWPSPIAARLGSCHAIELPFVFGNMDGARMARLIGNHPPQRLSDTMQDAWTTFARTGDPNTKGLSGWKAYNPQTRATMVLDVTAKPQDNPYGEDTQVWQGVPFDSVYPSL